MRPGVFRTTDACFESLPEYLAQSHQFTRWLTTTPLQSHLTNSWLAWQEILRLDRPAVLRIFDAMAPVTRASASRDLDAIPGSEGRPHNVLDNGRHFLREDDPQGITEGLVDWLDDKALDSKSATSKL